MAARPKNRKLVDKKLLLHVLQTTSNSLIAVPRQGGYEARELGTDKDTSSMLHRSHKNLSHAQEHVTPRDTHPREVIVMDKRPGSRNVTIIMTYVQTQCQPQAAWHMVLVGISRIRHLTACFSHVDLQEQAYASGPWSPFTEHFPLLHVVETQLALRLDLWLLNSGKLLSELLGWI